MQLGTLQRAMRRKMLRCQKRDGESWSVCLSRESRHFDQEAAKLALTPGLRSFGALRWLWAGHVARVDDCRWPRSTNVFNRAHAGVAFWLRPHRVAAGSGQTKWGEDVALFCRRRNVQDWMTAAADLEKCANCL